MKFSFSPATKKNWKQLQELFGERGACAGCWCMFFRLPRAQYERQKGNENKIALKKLVDSQRPPGVLAFDKDQAVAWCAVAPRMEYERLQKSKILRPVDEVPVWSVTCFFVHRKYRRKGLNAALLAEAAKLAKRSGATVLEGYPVDPDNKSMPDTFMYHGLVSAFRKAGFREVARRSESRPIMRLEL